MSYDVNFSYNQPVIKAAANMNNDGGSGGNTGFMSQGRRKNKDGNGSLFGNDENKKDSFELSTKLPSLDKEPELSNTSSWMQKLMKKLSA
jgi:hypothetical protein